jgi:hypothetical protein
MHELDRNNLSLLAVFDHVFDALSEQRRAAVADDGTCVYRTEEGLKCAAGHLIPDANYHPILEGKDCRSQSVRKAIDLPTEYQPLVHEMQTLHDRILTKNYNSWCTAMQAMRTILSAYVPNA